MMTCETIPVCLTIAGSDSGGGAGIQADLRTFHALGVYGASVLTAVTAQNPRQLTQIHPIPLPDVQAQLEAVVTAYHLAGVKTGMLFSADVIAAVSGVLEHLNAPVVVDPVMVSTSGARLLEENAVDAMVDLILPITQLLTPNLPEAELILARSINSAEEMVDAAFEISQRGPAVYLKGGHLAAAPGTDILVENGKVHELTAPPLECLSSHGTGCTLSAALAAGVAKGLDIPDAAVVSKAFVWHSLNNVRMLGPEVYGLYPPAELDASVVSVRRLR